MSGGGNGIPLYASKALLSRVLNGRSFETADTAGPTALSRYESQFLLTTSSPANYTGAMRIIFTLLLPILLIVHSVPSTTLALERHIHARAGGSSAQVGFPIQDHS